MNKIPELIAGRHIFYTSDNNYYLYMGKFGWHIDNNGNLSSNKYWSNAFGHDGIQQVWQLPDNSKISVLRRITKACSLIWEKNNFEYLGYQYQVIDGNLEIPSEEICIPISDIKNLMRYNLPDTWLVDTMCPTIKNLAINRLKELGFIIDSFNNRVVNNRNYLFCTDSKVYDSSQARFTALKTEYPIVNIATILETPSVKIGCLILTYSRKVKRFYLDGEEVPQSVVDNILTKKDSDV